MQTINIRKVPNTTMVTFELDNHLVASMSCTLTIDPSSRQNRIEEWLFQIQAQSLMMADPQIIIDFQNRMAFITQFCIQLRAIYVIDPNGFLALGIEQNEDLQS